MLHSNRRDPRVVVPRDPRGAREDDALPRLAARVGLVQSPRQALHAGSHRLISGDFTLRLDGRRLAGAVKTSVLRRGSRSAAPRGATSCAPRGIMRRSYELVEGAGRSAPSSRQVFTRKGRARLPRELPFETSVFVLVARALMWQRAERTRAEPARRGGRRSAAPQAGIATISSKAPKPSKPARCRRTAIGSPP